MSAQRHYGLRQQPDDPGVDDEWPTLGVALFGGACGLLLVVAIYWGVALFIGGASS